MADKIFSNKDKLFHPDVTEVSDALAKLTLVIKLSKDLKDDEKQNYFEILNSLNEEALRHRKKRLNETTLKIFINYGLETLCEVGDLIKDWNDLRPAIKSFFLSEKNKT